MSSVNLKNLSQDELNKILKEEYKKNRKLKKERSIQLIVVNKMFLPLQIFRTHPYKTPVIIPSFLDPLKL